MVWASRPGHGEADEVWDVEMNNMLFYEAVRTFAGPLFDFHYHFNTEGADKIPEEGGALIVANHRSLLDPIVIAYGVERFINFAEASYGFQIPVVKQLSQLAGAFPLSIYGGEESDRNINKANQLLERGELVGIFPEGVQSFFNPHRVTKIANFKTGFAKLALENRVPIIPVAVVPEEERELPKIPGFLLSAYVRVPGAKDGLRLITYHGVTCRIGRSIDLSQLYDEPLTKALIDRVAGRIRRIVIKLYDGEELDVFMTGEKPFDFANGMV